MNVLSVNFSYMLFCIDSTTVVDLFVFLGGVGSVLIKVRGDLVVVC